MPSPSKSAKDGAPPKNGAAWPDMTQAGAGLDIEIPDDDPLSAPIEKLEPQPFSLKREVKKHPGLYFGLGALAVTGIAVFLSRGMIAKAARPMLFRVAARRPLQTARLAAKHPRTAARIAADFARDLGERPARIATEFAKDYGGRSARMATDLAKDYGGRSARMAAGLAKDLGDRLPRRGRA
jgi:hypothetical protein